MSTSSPPEGCVEFSDDTGRDSLSVWPTAAQVDRLLALRGKLRPGIPAKVPSPSERRLRLDRLLVGGARFGDPGSHSG